MEKVILVVDDTYHNRFLISEFLKQANYKVIQAENGKVAIDYLTANKVDLILLDIEMPVMNGFETLRFIRDKMPLPTSKLPICAITAHNPELFEGEFASNKFTDLLTKPFTHERIMNLVKKFVG